MAIASLIISIAGLVLSFILGFPLSYIIGPPIGLAMGLAGMVLGALALKSKKNNLSKAALIIGIAVAAVSVIRILSLVACAGRIGSCIGCIAGI